MTNTVVSLDHVIWVNITVSLSMKQRKLTGHMLGLVDVCFAFGIVVGY
jgi:hypothetical protein